MASEEMCLRWGSVLATNWLALILLLLLLWLLLLMLLLLWTERSSSLVNDLFWRCIFERLDLCRRWCPPPTPPDVRFRLSLTSSLDESEAEAEKDLVRNSSRDLNPESLGGRWTTCAESLDERRLSLRASDEAYRSGGEHGRDRVLRKWSVVLKTSCELGFVSRECCRGWSVRDGRR